MSGADPHARVRFFSLEEANRTLPLVRRIVRDIRDEYRELQPPLRRFQSLDSDAETSQEGRRLRSELDARTERLNGYLQELLDLGCQFKGFDDGLVDYHAMLEGRPVLLCWKLGEPEIGWWHEIDAGFAGRQRIDEAVRTRLQEV